MTKGILFSVIWIRWDETRTLAEESFRRKAFFKKFYTKEHNFNIDRIMDENV